MKNTFEILQLKLNEKAYTHKSSESEYKKLLNSIREFSPKHTMKKLLEEEKRNYSYHDEINIPIGKSRIGGPIVDLPDNIEYPKNHYFTAQINLSEIAKIDATNQLPKTGFLYFFVKKNGNKGIVKYSELGEASLKRVELKHFEWNYSGKIIESFEKSYESLVDRYESDPESDTGRVWNYFAGNDVTKIFGIYTNCQASESKVLKKISSEDDILLLQIGSNYCGVGVQLVYIKRNDLIAKDFSKCKFEYSQG